MSEDYKKTIAFNRKARYEYHIEETFEAGLMLLGSEVKSLRKNSANISDAYVSEYKGELYINNINIPEYKEANRFNHDPKRRRKLLLNKKEIKKLIGKLKVRGTAIIAVSLYFNHKNIAKLEVALGVGKKEFDKREDKKQRDWQREKSRVMKDK